MIGTTLNQRFSLEKELGRGGMGAVYKATDQILGRAVAIKILKDRGGEEVGRKIRLEAQITARLLHENVVRLYDFGTADGTYYLVMEEVDGTSYFRRWRHIPLLERLRIIAQVADALDYAHHQGVIHRDIKPGNVLLTAADQAKLSDFGLSMIAEHEGGEVSQTIRGTPHYMSPEQATGQRVDHRSDLYSLGIMLYESTVGSIPFQGEPMAILMQHVNKPPESPRARNPEVSPALDRLILDLLAKSPDDRPISGAAVASALRDEIAREKARANIPTADLPVIPSGAAEKASGPSPTVAAPAPVAALPAPSAAPPSAPPLVRAMLEAIQAEPIALSPDDRYLYGHYLAYLLGGSRRRGFFMRRPLDPRNADRGRIILAMTSVMLAGGTEESIARAGELLDKRIDVRPSLNPVIVAKYLASRATPNRRKKFRHARRLVLAASTYAQEHMTDANGLLNPGLIPQTIDDLRKLAPERTEVDDQLVGRWNRVAEVWRGTPSFRDAVLRYATHDAHRDPASIDLWPEVVYPLIERARWQRQFRSKFEAVWDNLFARVLHVPDAGVRLDRAIKQAVPAQVVDQFDLSLDAFEDEDPEIDDEAAPGEAQSNEIERLTVGIGTEGPSLHDLAVDRVPARKGMVRLATPDPRRFLLGELRELWDEALAALRAPGAKAKGHRLVPVGPYRLVVVPSIRGRSAAQVVFQGMTSKQIEMATPSIRLGSTVTKPIIAVWLYQDNSLAITHLDFKNNDRYILWHAPTGMQSNFDTAADLNHELLQLGLEAPDQLDRVLTKRFRPTKPA